MTIIGTIYDVFIHQENLKKNEINKIDDSKCVVLKLLKMFTSTNSLEV
jgi:hypothetical protein